MCSFNVKQYNTRFIFKGIIGQWLGGHMVLLLCGGLCCCLGIAYSFISKNVKIDSLQNYSFIYIKLV